MMNIKSAMSYGMGIVLAAGALIGPDIAANSQDAKKYTLNYINCSELRNDPHICLINDTSLAIAGIDCEADGDSPEIGIPLPKGGIPAHSMAYIDMKKCDAPITFTMFGGGTRHTGKINTNKITSLEVPSK